MPPNGTGPSRRAKQAAKRPAPKVRAGRKPRILDGYQRTKGTWTARSPAQVVLTALTTGATWEIAAKVAGLHEDTPNRWDARGTEIAAELDDPDADLAAAEPEENHAYLHFHRAAQNAKVQMVRAALGTIDQAQRGGNLNAAEIVLKRHPMAAPYRPAETHELTGKNGGAIPIDVRSEARAVLESMVERLAANQQKPSAEETPE